MENIRTITEWQSWLESEAMKEFPTLKWGRRAKVEPFIYGTFDCLSSTRLSAMAMEIGLSSNALLQLSTFSVSIVTAWQSPAKNDAFLLPLSRGKLSIYEAASEAKQTIRLLVSCLKF